MGSAVSAERVDVGEPPITTQCQPIPELTVLQPTDTHRKSQPSAAAPPRTSPRASQFRSIESSPQFQPTEDAGAALSARREGIDAQSFSPVVSRATSPSMLSGSAAMRRPPSVTFSDAALVLQPLGSAGGSSVPLSAHLSEVGRSLGGEDLMEESRRPFPASTATPLGSQDLEGDEVEHYCRATGNPLTTAVSPSDPGAAGGSVAPIRSKITAPHVKHRDQLAVPKVSKNSVVVL